MLHVFDLRLLCLAVLLPGGCAMQSTSAPADQASACTVPVTALVYPQPDYPAFEAAKPTIPAFEGRSCSLGEWQAFLRRLAPVGRQINEHDEARIDHDRKVRAFDRELHLAHARGECSNREYERLARLISDANALNAGTRRDAWRELQSELTAAEEDAALNIKRLNVDVAAQCGD